MPSLPSETKKPLRGMASKKPVIPRIAESRAKAKIRTQKVVIE